MPDSALLENRLERFLGSNPTGKTLVVVNSCWNIAEMAAPLRRVVDRHKRGVAILCIKSRVPEQFEAFGENVILPKSYLTGDDHERVDRHVFDYVSKTWDELIKKEYPLIFMYHGIELARIAEYDLQLFLLARVKAALIMDRVMRREGYRAVFIIDSNRELDDFSRFIEKRYGVASEMFRFEKNRTHAGAIKERLARCASKALDILASFSIVRIWKHKIIDAKLFLNTSICQDKDCLPVICEEGVFIRLKSLARAGGYVGLLTRPPAKKPAGLLTERVEDFNVDRLAGCFVFEGMPYWELVRDEMHTLVTKDFKRIRRNIDIFYNSCGRQGMRSIVLRNDLKELEKTVILASRAKNIPTLVVQHGILAEHNGHSVIHADTIAVWGEYGAVWYKRFGNENRKILVTGNPAFDIMFKAQAGHDKDKLLRFLGLAGKRSLVTVISPGQSMFRQTAFVYDDVAENIIRGMVKAVATVRDVNLVIKLHPNEDPAVFSGFIDTKDRGFVSMVDKTDLRALISVSDLVVTMDSTVGLEAVMAGKPLMVINLTGRKDLIPYVERGVATGVYADGDIEPSLRTALYDETARKRMAAARDKFIGDLAYSIDGKAAERISRLIIRLSAEDIKS